MRVDRPAVVLHPADRVLRLRRDGTQHVAVQGRRVDRVLAVGRVPRRRRGDQGRADEDLVVDAPRPQHDAAGVEDHRQLRELVAGQGRGAARPATTRRSCSAPTASCRSAPARTSSSSRHGMLITPPLSAGALAGITQDSVTTIARDHGFEVRVDDLAAQRPLRRRGDVRVRHRGRGERGELGRRPRDPVPRPDDQGHRRANTPRPSAARSTSTRTGVSSYEQRPARVPSKSRDLRHDAARRVAARGHLADGRGQAADRGAARLARRRTTSRRAGRARTRRTTSSSGARPHELKLDDEHARRVRVDAARQGQGRQRRHAAPPRGGRTSAPCASSASRGTTTCSRRSAPRSTRAWRWSPTRSSSCAARAWTCCSTPSTSSTATSAIPSSRCACSRRRRRTARATSCCATPTAARCRTRSSGSSREVVAYFGGDVKVAVHLHDDAGTGVANALAGVLRRRDPGAGNDQRLRRAHRQLQPHDDHPEPHVEDGVSRRSRATAWNGSRRSRITSPSS